MIFEILRGDLALKKTEKISRVGVRTASNAIKFKCAKKTWKISIAILKDFVTSVNSLARNTTQQLVVVTLMSGLRQTKRQKEPMFCSFMFDEVLRKSE